MPDFKMTAEQKMLFDALTPLQQKVCVNSLSGLSNIDSYIKAGGKGKTQAARENSASQIFSKLEVKAFLDSMKAAAVSSAVMSRQEMMERLSTFSRVGLNDLIEWAEIDAETVDGEPIKQSVWMVKPSAMQDPIKMSAIAELAATKDGIKIKTHSQLAAMNQLADLAGYKAASKLDLTSLGKSMAPKDPRELTDEELAKIIGD